MSTLETNPADTSPAVTAPVERQGADLLAWLLAEQQQLTAVEEFARAHEFDEVPEQARNYHSLLPAVPPGAGQQYAFEVDLDRCSGCKACVTACHSLNGLDEHETWRDVGLLIGGTRTAPVMQHVTTACHHCLEPACAAACPVNAYEKDPLTGIVKHLDDQCFGCQYCTLACPYDVPKYHAGKGIVRKCDLCSTRLAAGEAPACVQSCPHEAIAIRVVDQQQIIDDAEANVFLPAAPEPWITLPTTSYKTRRSFPRNMLPADYYRVSPQHAHWPLVLMLVLTQLSVGAFCTGLFLECRLGPQLTDALRPVHATAALFFGLLALGASTIHLGRPHLAFRAIVGLRHSWLSREILAFGVFAGLAMAYAGSTWLATDHPAWQPLVAGLGWGVALFGAIGVFSSAMIYAFTQREFWSLARSGWRFLLTSMSLGIAAVWLTLLIAARLNPGPELAELVDRAGPTLCQVLMLVAGIKLLLEAAFFRHLASRQVHALKRSALLMIGELSNATLARFATGLLGGLAMPAFLLLGELTQPTPLSGPNALVTVAILFVACLAGETLERYLFFRAVAAPRMPGGVRS